MTGPKLQMLLQIQPLIPFDAYEVGRVHEFADTDGSTFCERCDDLTCEQETGADVQHEPDPVRTFWTVYGHMPDAGVMAVSDCDKREDALDILSHILGRVVDMPEGATWDTFPVLNDATKLTMVVDDVRALLKDVKLVNRRGEDPDGALLADELRGILRRART